MKILLFGNEYQQHYANELRHLVMVLRRNGAEIEVNAVSTNILDMCLA